MSHAPLTAERLRKLLDYDPQTGVFRWREHRAWNATVGSVAGSPNNKGYLNISIDDRLYKAHRLAWFYIHGRWPADQLDHRDGDRRNNRLGNLREADNAQNCQNQHGARVNNATGFRGVWRSKGRYRACIGIDGRNKHLGYFDTPEAAGAAYRTAKLAAHPFYNLERSL